MKRFLQISILALVAVLGSSLQNQASAQYRDDVSYQTFYDELSPYGRWIDYPEYGYVWSPSEEADFRPYSSGGHWAWSEDYDWMWVSDYDWGWAPFHYGRWFNDPSYGWLWVPGYEWSSAWVAWRDGGDYYGWAPIRPGINININFSLGSYNAPDIYWSFAPRRYITSRNIYNHCIDWRHNVTIIHQTTIINNYNYGRNGWRTGPQRYDVERYTGRIEPVRFRESNRPGRNDFRNNEVTVYRPTIQRNDNNRFSPRKFERADRSRITNDPNTGNDSRSDRNGPRLERNNNDFRRNNNTVNEQNNNLPRKENNNGFERRDININRPVEPQNNNSNNDPRRSEQPRFGERNNRSSNEERIIRPVERTRVEPRNDNEARRFERTDNNRPSNERPVERTNPATGNTESRRFERSNEPVRQRQEANTPRSQEQPRQFEKRENRRQF
jgi:hypothetical protein